MSRSRVLVFTFMALFILAAVVDSATIVRRSIPEVFNSPFHVLGKRNQFYGLFKPFCERRVNDFYKKKKLLSKLFEVNYSQRMSCTHGLLGVLVMTFFFLNITLTPLGAVPGTAPGVACGGLLMTRT
ncbi:hypothetical protein NECAME_10597 [Necator americanus]|uniref:Uncharacterized protein n=1 Tax=Necator americanus TaxID=51031 RepID=W2T7U6_NECAM|nr:hypothetical protein NECAME_10597 [Necator americanus]ETN78090.1 hypothetical protein NECAME_10597 [Necator americanus]